MRQVDGVEEIHQAVAAPLAQRASVSRKCFGWGPVEARCREMPDWIVSGSHVELRFGWSKEQTAAVADALGLDAKMSEDMRHVTAMVVCDIVVNWQTRGKETFYSRSRDFYSDMPGRYRSVEFLSYYYVTGASDWLARRGYITQTLGTRNPGPSGDSYRTYAKPTPVLLDLVTGLIDVAEPRMAEKTPELIILRDAGGKSVDYDDTEETRRMRLDMVEINARSQALCRPRLDGREVQMPWLVRIFNVDFDHGGRLYFKGNSSQNMPRVDRRRVEVEIDDALHTTIELDYSTLHLALGYAEEWERRPRQPYAIKGFSRDEVKVATNVAINAPNELSAIRAIAMDQAEQERKSHPTRTHLARARAVYSCLTRKHWRARNLIGSGAGLRLQRIDSDIAVAVMLSLLRQDIPVLPIHDSFLVAAQHQEELWVAMASAARTRGYDLEIHGGDNIFEAQAITHPGANSTSYPVEAPRHVPHGPRLSTGGYCSDQHLHQRVDDRGYSEPSGKTGQAECSGTDPPRRVCSGYHAQSEIWLLRENADIGVRYECRAPAIGRLHTMSLRDALHRRRAGRWRSVRWPQRVNARVGSAGQQVRSRPGHAAYNTRQRVEASA